MMTSVERHAVRKLVRLIVFVLPWCQLGHAGEYRLPIITERHNLYGQSGLIKTPNYPALVSSAMPKEFIWTITVPSGHRINIQFIHLNIACAVAQLYYGKDYSRTHCGDDVVASFVIPERRTSIKLTCRLSGSCGHFLAMYEAFETSIPQSVCESSNSFIFNGNCYQINKSPMFSWKSAESQCKNINYDLITITSYEENEIIAAKLNGTSAWIGLIRNANTKGTFLWKNGTSVVMTNWVSGKPNGFAGKNCTVLKSNATWVNTNCNDTEAGYICKKAINPLPSTCKDSFGIQNGGIWDNLLSASSSNAKHAKLHGPQSWRPDNLDVDGLWLQIMMPNKTLANIRGIATQGDPNNAGNFVKTFTLSFSQMEDDLIPYRNSYWIEQVFQGNNDNNNVMYNKINPVIIGWRLRIHPKTSSGATAMRFEIYGCFLNDTEVEKAPIGVQSGAVQDPQITSSTLSEGCNPRYARLHLDSSKYKNTWRTIVVDHAQWLQIKLKSAYHISGIATQAGNLFDQPTRKYYLSYIESTSLFVFYKHRGEIKYFLGNTDNTTVVQNTIVPGIFTKVVRIHPYEWTNGGMTLRVELYGHMSGNMLSSIPYEWTNGGMTLRVELYGHMSGNMLSSIPYEWTNGGMTLRVELYGHMSALPKGDLCSKSVGIAEGAIPASSITVSSSCKSPIQVPKLNVAGSSWCTLIARGRILVKNWIKVKLNNLTKLTGVATQGASTGIGWVKKYRLEYSIDGTTFTAYTYKGDFKIFDGNYDNGTIIKQELPYPVHTRYVLLHPTQYHQIIALRMELYGCQVQEKDYPLCNSPMGLGSGFIPAWALKSNAKNDSRVKDVRLDTSNISSRAWFPTFETTQKWLQVDFGLPSNITGIATMGTTQNSYKLESYQLEYRMNRDDRPKNYSTGASIMVFKGNENGNMITKHHLVPSIFAQFIKIVHWQTKISLKVEFYGCGNAYTGSVKRREKCNVSAGIEDGAFLIPSFKASSVRRPVHFSWKSVGLSQSPYVWKPRYQNTYQWIKIHFSSLHNIAAIKTEGNDLDMEWISSFMLKYKMDGQSFKTHKEIGQNTSTIFIGNSADRRTVKNMLQPIITANTIRLLPVSWVKAIALRLELYGCRLLRRNLGCDQALRIGEPDASVNISVSSSMTIYFEPWQGRLHFVNSRRPFWSPLETDPNPWLQVDLGKLLNLTGVATQGAGSTSLLIDGNSFVKSYILAFAEDDGVFTKYVENENTRVFFGNTDSDSIVRRYFASRVQAKYSRLHPLTWNNTVALRMEFYGCGNEHSKWVTQNHQVVRIGCFSSIKQFLPGEKYSSKQTNGFEFCSKKAVMERWSSFAVLQSKYQCHKGPDNNDIQQAEHSYLCQNWTGGGQSGSSDFFIVIAHGNFSTWSHWSNCTESRGIGEKYRSRNCTNPAPLNGGKDCIGPFHETTSCNITKPAEWSNWGPCSTFCGPGVQNRTRSSNYAISNNNSNDIEFKQCNNSECFVLRNWTACAIVNNKCEKARASRKTDCTDPISGKKCYGCIKEIKSCNTSTMVIRYGNWSSCSKTCGEGRKNKKKYCTFYYSSFVDGSNVSSSKTFHISKSCNIRRCPVNGGWGPWSSSLCSQPCGNGTKTRQRQCNRPSPAHGGRNCEGPGTQRLECKLKECPVNGSYTTWGNWSRCSATCGNGTQVRTRNCTNPPPQHGGTCNGDASQVRICLMTICAIPINGGFSSWGNWSLCTLTCGNGTQQRTRNCSNPTPTNGGRNCTGRYTERQNCNTIPCPQIDGNFTAWSSWSTCTLTCGNGTQQRKRTCTNPKPQNGGVNCTGLYRETQNCNTQSCPTHRVDGGFTSWSQWSTCTVTCGSGIQKRMRTCTNPWPANGGSNCTGRFTEMRSCNTRHCPINGNWTDWSDWSYCNKPCGTGDEFKVRTCTNPPAQYGGEDCVGPSNKSRICNPNPCPAAEVSVVARFTKETWNDDLENLQSQASRALKEKMWANIRALYRNDPSVTGIIVHSFRHGSVIANFSIQYQTLNSLKLLTLKDTMQVKGVLSDMPIKMVNISSNKVPTSSPTFTEAKNISSTSLNLKWLPISSSDLHGLSLSSYIIFYREKSQQYTVDKMKSVRPQDTSTVIDGLLKYTDYSLRILATTANGNGIPSDPLDVKTDEDVPSQSPPNFQVVSKNSTYIAVLWNPINPAYHHGIFRGYNLTLTNQKTGKQIALIYSKEKLSSLFNGLDEYTYYDIRVCGFTSKGCGSQSVLIVRTDEDKPSSSPPNTKVLDFISTSSMKLSWQPIPEDDVNGVLKGHRIRYTILKTSGNPLENAKPMIMTVEPHATSVILENLTSYSEYEILLSAFTSAGDGPTSIVVGETCRCPKFMPTNYWPHKPYLTRFKNRTIGGIFPRIIDSMVVSVCGSCSNGHGKTVVDFDYDGRKQPSMKPGLIPMIGGLDQGTGLSFPVNGNKDMTNVYGEYPFVPLVQSPGVVFLAAKKLPGSHVQNLFNSLINCAPLIAMSFLIAYLAGITMWVLDLKSSQAFPTSFLQGAPEGLWWAYITMTTVGYGDRVPKSFLARTFAILWTLYGIVIASMVTSSMTSSLTAVIIHPDKKIYGTKIAAVHKSCEHRLGILMNGIFDENKVYHNLEEVLQALNRREVEGALVDTYVAESETSLFKNSQIKITKTIGRSFGYGFALSGDAVRLENEFRNYYMVNERNILNIIGENVQSGSLKLNSGHSEEDAPVNIFDSSLVIYQQTLAVLGCLLFCAICIGLIWQLYYKKKQLENKVKHINDANITQRKCQKFITEARKLVDEFCRSTRQILTEMKHRHALEQHLIVMKKHQQYRHLKKFLERYRE